MTCPIGILLPHLDDSRHLTPGCDTIVRKANQCCGIMCEHETPFVCRPTQKRRIVSLTEPSIHHSYKIQLWASPEQATHNCSAKVLISQQLHATSSTVD